jgi:DNA (cytosine-5)-methyltransferase 1
MVAVMAAWYNEVNPYAAGWLRNLVANGLIPAGDVDQRDIRDVCAADLAGYTQCHFFAGIGIWPYAARLAGWPDDRPLWTGSCPCQPFSAAGKRNGFADERHLWPSWHWLIEQHRPCVIFGEQVASADGLKWLDLVSSDLEACGYAIGPVDFPSAGIGAPNIRQRLWWMADSNRQRWVEAGADNATGRHDLLGSGCTNGGLVDSSRNGRGAQRVDYRPNDRAESDAASETRSGLGNAGNAGLSHAESSDVAGAWRGGQGRTAKQPGRPFDPWRELEWLDCSDGRRRPTQPGLFPLAARHPGDVGKLRAYGNALNAEVAAEVIASYLDLDRN